MPNSTSTPFPATQQDISNLKQTATDAVSDLSSTAGVHASKAKSQAKELVGHVQQEGAEQVQQLKGSLNDLVEAARGYALERPLACLGAAFASGFLFALYFRSSRD